MSGERGEANNRKGACNASLRSAGQTGADKAKCVSAQVCCIIKQAVRGEHQLHWLAEDEPVTQRSTLRVCVSMKVLPAGYRRNTDHQRCALRSWKLAASKKKKRLHVLLEYSSLRDSTKPHLFAAAAENLNLAALSHSRLNFSPSANARAAEPEPGWNPGQ